MENKNYITGIIGGLLGGLIAAIPWLLMYVYGNMILSFLAFIIAIGVLKGYQLFKGKTDEKLPKIVTIISLISITITTFIFIPGLLLLKEYGSVSIDKIISLYDYSDFVSAIIKDYVISLLFTILGISGVISNIKKQLAEGKNVINVKLVDKEKQKEDKELKEKIIEEFIRQNATSKYQAVNKEDVLNKLDIENKELLFINLTSNRILVPYKNKYYYSEKNYKHPLRRTFIIVAIIFSVVAFLTGIFLGFSSNTDGRKLINHNGMSFYLPTNWNEYKSDEEENKWFYVPKKDETGFSGVISIEIGENQYKESEWETFMNYGREYFAADFNNDLEKVKTSSYILNDLYRVVEFDVNYEKDEEYEASKNKFYYILKDNKYILIYATDYYSKEINVDKTTKIILENFNWE